jgi:DNA-binding transcriptional regulator YiaG
MKTKKLTANVAGVRASIEYRPRARGRVGAGDVRRLELAAVAEILASSRPLSGEQLRWLRSVMGLDQIGLARLLGLSRATIIRYEAQGDLPRQSDYAIRFLVLRRLSPEGIELFAADLASAKPRPATARRRARRRAA